jgi:hypothetical protein
MKDIIYESEGIPVLKVHIPDVLQFSTKYGLLEPTKTTTVSSRHKAYRDIIIPEISNHPKGIVKSAYGELSQEDKRRYCIGLASELCGNGRPSDIGDYLMGLDSRGFPWKTVIDLGKHTGYCEILVDTTLLEGCQGFSIEGNCTFDNGVPVLNVNKYTAIAW